ncbi:MAG: hypothetical protein P1U34_09085 [Coxiellaceae bacterium]|nr:hypothetical protein [Coxiellaceae bacterium]
MPLKPDGTASAHSLLTHLTQSIVLPSKTDSSIFSSTFKMSLLLAVFVIAIVAACVTFHHCAQTNRPADEVHDDVEDHYEPHRP